MNGFIHFLILQYVVSSLVLKFSADLYVKLFHYKLLVLGAYNGILLLLNQLMLSENHFHWISGKHTEQGKLIKNCHKIRPYVIFVK